MLLLLHTGSKLKMIMEQQDEVVGTATVAPAAPQAPQWHWAHQMAMALYSPMFNPMLHCAHPATAWLMQQQQQQGSFGSVQGGDSDGATEVVGVAMAPVTATGLPVLDVICQQRMMLHAAQQQQQQVPTEAHGDSAHSNSDQVSCSVCDCLSCRLIPKHNVCNCKSHALRLVTPGVPAHCSASPSL
jgi:hypothetical protein